MRVRPAWVVAGLALAVAEARWPCVCFGATETRGGRPVMTRHVSLVRTGFTGPLEPCFFYHIKLVFSGFISRLILLVEFAVLYGQPLPRMSWTGSSLGQIGPTSFYRRTMQAVALAPATVDGQLFDGRTSYADLQSDLL